MFPDDEWREESAERAEGMQPSRMPGDAPPALGLPKKATCTVGEAHEHTGISKRQLRYYVEDGTLLAVNAARVPVGSASGRRKGGERDRWRIVVRRSEPFQADGFKSFLTLEEFIRSRFNKECK